MTAGLIAALGLHRAWDRHAAGGRLDGAADGLSAAAASGHRPRLRAVIVDGGTGPRTAPGSVASAPANPTPHPLTGCPRLRPCEGKGDQVLGVPLPARLFFAAAGSARRVGSGPAAAGGAPVTSHKHLKDAVRARMARTGERYTTAHRHLTGAASARPAGVVPGYPAFGGGRHHDSALLAHVLEAAGVTAAHDGQPLDEPMVAGLAGGIGFMYFSFSYAGHAADDDDRAADPPAAVPRRRPGAGGHRRTASRETTSAAKAARELDAALDAGGTPDLHRRPRRRWATRSGPTCFAGAEPYDVAVVGRRGTALLLDDDRAWSRSRSAPTSSPPRAPPTARAGTAWSSWSRPPRAGRPRAGDPGVPRRHRARPHRGRHAGQLRRQLRPPRPGEVGGPRSATAARPRGGAGCSTAAPRSATPCAGCTTA